MQFPATWRGVERAEMRPKRSSSVQATFRHSLWLTCAATLLALEIAGAPVRGQGQPPLPERLDSYIKSYVKLTSEEQTATPRRRAGDAAARRRPVEGGRRSSARCGSTRRLPATSPP